MESCEVSQSESSSQQEVPSNKANMPLSTDEVQSSSRKHEQKVTERDVAGANSPSQRPEARMKTSDLYKVHDKVPRRFNNPECFKGYGKMETHPCYKTTSDDYGGMPPSVHTMPTKFFGKSQKFTGYYMKFGMYRNHSFNTGEDKSIV